MRVTALLLLILLVVRTVSACMPLPKKEIIAYISVQGGEDSEILYKIPGDHPESWMYLKIRAGKLVETKEFGSAKPILELYQDVYGTLPKFQPVYK